LKVATLCSRAYIDGSSKSKNLTDEEINKLSIISDASEQGIMKFCLKFHDTEEYKSKNEKIFEIPFDSKKKWQISIHDDDEGRVIVIKGNKNKQ
jgi:magnesium-transporting ATPase (P-type)